MNGIVPTCHLLTAFISSSSNGTAVIRLYHSKKNGIEKIDYCLHGISTLAGLILAYLQFATNNTSLNLQEIKAIAALGNDAGEQEIAVAVSSLREKNCRVWQQLIENCNGFRISLPLLDLLSQRLRRGHSGERTVSEAIPPALTAQSTVPTNRLPAIPRDLQLENWHRAYHLFPLTYRDQEHRKATLTNSVFSQYKWCPPGKTQPVLLRYPVFELVRNAEGGVRIALKEYAYLILRMRQEIQQQRLGGDLSPEELEVGIVESVRRGMPLACLDNIEAEMRRLHLLN